MAQGEEGKKEENREINEELVMRTRGMTIKEPGSLIALDVRM